MQGMKYTKEKEEKHLRCYPKSRRSGFGRVPFLLVLCTVYWVPNCGTYLPNYYVLLQSVVSLALGQGK